jgi:hypothetical protein
VIDHRVWWYLARSSGLMAWAILSASVCWGLVVAGRLTRRIPPPAWNLDVHRFLGGLGLVFTVLHVLTLVADSYVHIGWASVLVPMASTWRPGAVAWGVVALYLLIAVEGTSLLRRWLPRRLWRAVHMASFALFATATVHGLTAGTDATNKAALAMFVAVSAAAVTVLGLRVVSRRRAQLSPRRP